MPPSKLRKHALVWFMVENRTDMNVLFPLSVLGSLSSFSQHTRRSVRHSEGRLMLKRLIACLYLERWGVELMFDDIEIKRSLLGKPSYVLRQYPSLPTYDISISYSDQTIVVALAVVSRIKIGIDIEKIRRLPSTVREAFLTPKEVATLDRMVPSYVDAHTVLSWSIKESYLKAVGLGLRLHPRYVEIGYTRDGVPLTVTRTDIPTPLARVVHIERHEPFVLSLVTV